VTVDADGDFVVAWSSDLQDGHQRGVFARRFSITGSALAVEFQVNQYTGFNQWRPSVAADADGDFVVAWESAGQDGAAYGVFARRFSSSGAGLGSEFGVNTITSGYQIAPAVGVSTSGAFVVTWMGDRGTGDFDILAQRYSSSGSPVGGEFVVNTYTDYKQRFPSVASTASGDFVVVWSSYREDGSLYGVFGRRFSSAGTALATEFQINTYTGDLQDNPAVAVDADGDFVVVWESRYQDGATYGVFAQRFSSAGSRLATEFRVNTSTAGSQMTAAVASKGNGDFVVTWTSYPDSDSDVYARRFSSAGTPLAAEFLVNTFTGSRQNFPAVASSTNGRFVVAWASKYQDGSVEGVFAQRFAVPIPFDVDGDGASLPLTDALLTLRYLFGFRGATLITGAVNLAGCTRCDAPSIESYLAANTG
jgi:hypothetical protein